jgi:hypothetical protein
MSTPKKGITASRVSPEKIQFIIDNYSILTRSEIAQQLKESPRWIKRQIKYLAENNSIVLKQPPPEYLLSESDWTEEIKNRIIELKQKFLKSNIEITKLLTSEFNFKIKPGTLQFWIEKLNIQSWTKQDWMKEHLPKLLAEKLINEDFRISDISKYLKKEFDVYISEDLIHLHLNNIGVKNLRWKKIDEVNLKSQQFSKKWIEERLNGHVGIISLSKEMGVSKTLLMKRIKEEDLKILKHRKIWSKNLEILRDRLLEVSPIENIPPEDFHQMILGWLLGDGHIDENGRIVINHSLSQIDYLYLKTRILKKYLTNIVTVPAHHFSGSILGGSEQLGISCPGFSDYIKYCNSDGSKNLEKIISELNPLGWACYYMDDGSNSITYKVISMSETNAKYFENKYNFEKYIGQGQLIIKNIDSFYYIPGMAYKFDETKDSYWKKYLPELFTPNISTDLDLSLVKSYHINSPVIVKATEYYQKRGFPYFKISDDYLQKEFNGLKNFNTTYLWRTPQILRNLYLGNNIFKHFMTHMVEAKYRGISPKETFDNFMLLTKVLEYSLKTNKSILPDFLFNNLIFFNGGVVGFPCAVAKAIVEKFSKKNAIIVDPCAGWGGRLLGSVTADRKYVGFEPWDKTINGLKNIIDYFKITSATINNSIFDLNQAPPSCDLIFTSPPYINLEIYGKPIPIDEWKSLIQDIFSYAQKALKKDGYLILNIPKTLESFFPETILKKEPSIYWYTSARARKNPETLYVWKQ